ncbi:MULTISPECIES: hypothetical protein [Acidobacterium]|uniref:Uncharacterized protein n=1 Tax=Acidobacterium capsulatum (strain ATCC 51196 / DSM 11244 / BCRC 80197 / JCM 7670 / NBRC 15755 / NCIMB 13165 / 161) TaxID=240015 RepID=C1F567_ACIC5|nr:MULTISPECIES: hypothetical protein [Acidobacterium]ACO32508.1 hypothetical protein ACP_3155 [Acidobacterium capsulatum ATCC 51196]HCT61181.1 SAM-dependent methyltransferase [Acidobacterium sp.]
MIRSLFKRGGSGPERTSPTSLTGPRVPRHSSSWKALLQRLKAEEGLRVMDIGPTSPRNINMLTGMGHSVYMADLVTDAMTGNYELPPEEPGGAAGFDVPRFLEEESSLRGRVFDVVLLWAVLDYLPEPLVAPLVERLYEVTEPGSQVLVIFHSKKEGPFTSYCRYHITDSEMVEMQESEPYPVLRLYTNRGIERLFSKFSSCRFFLAKDDLYEVLITR